MVVDLWGPIQALLAIPSALQAVRDLTRSSPNSNDLEKHIGEIEGSLMKFSETGEWFKEAKEYHERLTHLSFGMGELVEAAALPRREGGFNPDRFNIQGITINWRKIKNVFIVPVVVFLDKSKFFITEGKANADKVNFIRIQSEIDVALRNYDPRSAEIKEKICIAVDKLEDLSRSEILIADRIIIDRALEIAQCLVGLRDGLRNR